MLYMNYWNINILISLFLSIVLGRFIIPKVRSIAFYWNLLDRPDARKIHGFMVPRLGGIVFAPIVAFVFFFMLGMNLRMGLTSIFDALMSDIGLFIFCFCAVMVLYVVGLADDLVGVRYKYKFVAQIFSAILIIGGGLYLKSFHGLLFLSNVPPLIGVPVTIFLFVFIINAMNFIDGVDGLASGLSIVVLAVYGIAFFALEYFVFSMLTFTMLGVIIPFFYYNVFGDASSNKKIFMGDTGSQTIGLIICFLGLKLLEVVKQNDVPEINSVMLVFSPLFLPCFDVVRVFLQRMIKRKNPFLPDCGHIHHRLIDAGFSKYSILYLIFSISVIITICNILLTRFINVNFVIIINVILWIGANMYLTHIIKNKKC